MAATFYKSILDSLSDGVYFVDRERNITYWNAAAEKITGYASEEVIGRNCSENLLCHVLEDGTQLCLNACPLVKCIHEGLPNDAEVYLRHKNGHRVPVHVRSNPMYEENGTIVGAVEVFSDNTHRHEDKKQLEALRRLALLCPLTSLANRRLLTTLLEQRLSELDRYGWRCGVLFIDIDRFKAINDLYGHLAGDQVLGQVAATLQNSVRGFDTVGRWGGEEFVCLLTNVQQEDVLVIAERCRTLVESCMVEAEGARIPVTISVGATLAEEDDSVESIIRRADRLMYNSKSEGRNRVTHDLDAVGKRR